MSEPTRYRVADNQAQLTLGGGVLVVDPAGPLVEYADYASLKAEVERLEPELEQRCHELNLSLGQQAVQLRQIGDLKAQLEHIDLLKSVVEKFFNSADLENPLDTQSHCAITEKLKQLPDCILDFTEEQVRDNPAWALAVFRHKVKEMQYKRVHDLNAIGGEQEENARLKAEVERLTKLCQATSPDGFVHVRDIKHHPIMGPAWEERQKVANLIPPIVESNAIPEGQAVLVNIYQHQQDAEEIKRLKAEVERLRKAGDAVSLCLEAFWKGKPYDTSTNIECFDAWNAAKEGKPSV